MKKLTKQIAVLAGLALGFAAFDTAFYCTVTRRYINSTSPEMQAKSIEVSRFVPFEPDSEVIRAEAPQTLSGDIPVIDGAAALLPVYAAFVQASYPPESVEFNGESYTPESKMQYTNTRGAYQGLAEGTVDIVIGVAPSAEQKSYAEEQGRELVYVPIAREAFVFIVNKDNPVDGLTSEQIRDIYSGKTVQWSEVGGRHILIDAVQRNPGSGSQSAMISFMNGIPMQRNPLRFFGSSIGFSFRYYVEGIVRNGGVKMLSVNGVYPDPAHIADGSYPVTTDVLAVYDAHNDNPNLPVLLDFICGETGQKIIEENGYVPLSHAQT